MSAPIQVRRVGDRVVLDTLDPLGESVVAIRLSPTKALELATALIGAAAMTQ